MQVIESAIVKVIEISHSMRDLAKMIGKSEDTSIEATHIFMKHCAGTLRHWVTLQPQGNVDGTKDYKCVIIWKSDLDYAKDPDTKNIGEWY